MTRSEIPMGEYSVWGLVAANQIISVSTESIAQDLAEKFPNNIYFFAEFDLTTDPTVV